MEYFIYGVTNWCSVTDSAAFSKGEKNSSKRNRKIHKILQGKQLLNVFIDFPNAFTTFDTLTLSAGILWKLFYPNWLLLLKLDGVAQNIFDALESLEHLNCLHVNVKWIQSWKHFHRKRKWANFSHENLRLFITEIWFLISFLLHFLLVLASAKKIDFHSLISPFFSFSIFSLFVSLHFITTQFHA